jgi:Uncharacterized protein conserved in bacteria (DUF2252)
MMNFVECTRRYDRWLAQRLTIVRADLQLKHRRMSDDPFFLLRATFYRWADLWPAVCAELRDVPHVLAVGDLHIENFGTWRDGEGRLIWGINDFDEATTLPYTNDLVRLATSTLLAIKGAQLATSGRRACEAVLEGYTAALEAGGSPVVLAERHRWLRDLALSRLKEQRAFWERLLALPTLKARMPVTVSRILRHAMPDRGLKYRVVHRAAGMGSLGRSRFTALAHWRGGTIARETKPLTSSAWQWLHGQHRPIAYATILERAVRVPDPFLQLHGSWVVRRLAPDCSRVELNRLSSVRDQCKLLWMMGWETGNVHLGNRAQRRAILRDLSLRKGNWLLRHARAMQGATLADWREWRRR